MRHRTFFLTIPFGAVLAVILVLLPSPSLPPPDPTAETSTPGSTRAAPAEGAAVQTETNTQVFTATKAVDSQGEQKQDGLALLQKHCVRCHPAGLLEGIKKSGPEWERTLERMEAMGVRLSDEDKDILLNFLASADRP